MKNEIGPSALTRPRAGRGPAAPAASPGAGNATMRNDRSLLRTQPFAFTRDAAASLDLNTRPRADRLTL